MKSFSLNQNEMLAGPCPSRGCRGESTILAFSSFCQPLMAAGFPLGCDDSLLQSLVFVGTLLSSPFLDMCGSSSESESYKKYM
jgi:hypothetical protein